MDDPDAGPDREGDVEWRSHPLLSRLHEIALTAARAQEAADEDDLVEVQAELDALGGALGHLVEALVAASSVPEGELAMRAEHHHSAVALAAAYLDGAGAPAEGWELLASELSRTGLQAASDGSWWPGVAVALCELVADALAVALEDDDPSRALQLLTSIALSRPERFT